VGEKRIPLKRLVIIAGTGRAGTTLIVKILTRMGLDTGFTEADLEGIDPIAQAGLERDPRDSDIPTIVKTPFFWEMAEEVLSKNPRKVRHVILPIRQLSEAAESRLRVHEINVSRFGTSEAEANEVQGGLTGTTSSANQEVILGRQLVDLIRVCNRYNVQYSFVNFPEFANDHEYLFQYLKKIFPLIKKKRLLLEAGKTCDSALIHFPQG
jgi:hypothetical protein